MNKFCLIGIGPHSKKKLIPSINKLPKTKYYIISKNIHKDLNYLRSFNSINKAIKTIHKDTKFIIASPPQLHFKHCYEISKNGYDIFIEKPSFLNENNFNTIKKLVKINKTIVVENLMYQHNKMYKYFLNKWKIFKKNKTSIDIKFTFPNFTTNSFRDENSI